MLLSNRFSFFNKKGDNINPQKRQATQVVIHDDAQFPGIGAIINAYTNAAGEVIYVEILDGGSNYGVNTYLEIKSIDDPALSFIIPNNEITISVDGVIEAVNIPSSATNGDFPYPSLDYIIDYSLERVSNGLIASDQIYILESVYNSAGKNTYTHPRVENYGPFNINSYEANGFSASLTILNYTFTSLIREDNLTKIYQVPASIINNLSIGMKIVGSNIPDDTFILSIDSQRQIIYINKSANSAGSISFTAFREHGLVAGSKIYVDGGSLDGGPYVLTKVNDYNLYFDSSVTVSSTSGSGVSYYVVPKYNAFLDGDDSFFLFSVDYNIDYPTIEKTKSLDFEFDEAASTDTIPSSGNGLYQRTVIDGLRRSPFALNIGHQADAEGSYLTVLRIVDKTFTTGSGQVFFGVYRAETEAEDERLGVMLKNIGRDVDLEQELIIRESDVNESNIDYILLNQKRKEMLLQGEQIWPYMGSYRGVVNMINWFGYYDLRLKEYFLNVNSLDTEFGKYRQVQVPFQLKDKVKRQESVNLVPSKHYKKTGLFGLFYDIVKDSGEYDEDGIPITEDAFEFTNEEALIKFFALKNYLRDKFLPLNTKIVDITGEGVYYERYTINSWKDVDERRKLELTRSIDFSCEERVVIEDLRPYSSNGYLSPTLDKTMQSFLNNYDILDITITNPGGPYTAIPQVSFPGSSNQQASGYVKVKGVSGSYSLANPSGVGFTAGDIITLGGGVYEIPLRLTVTNTSSGAVTDVDIWEGFRQGSGYSSFPPSFFQTSVVSPAPTGNQYQSVSRTGFTASPSDLGFQVEDVWFLNKGLGYSTYPSAVFLPNVGSTTADLQVRINGGTQVGNINNSARTNRWNDAANIPVGAVALLSTSFDVSWDEVTYSWLDLGSDNKANIKVYVDPLPSGNGEVIAAEIVSEGSGYTFVPDLEVVSIEGQGATLQGSLRQGKLNLLEYTVTGVASVGGTNDEFTVTPDIASLGSLSVSTNRLVTSDGISDLVLTSIVTPGSGSSTILVALPGGGSASTTVQIGDKIYVHEGVEVTNGGSGFASVPGVDVNGGHTRLIFTWDTLGRGEFYQMQWKVLLQEKEKPTDNFYYDSGIRDIDDLINHTVVLPYVGKYTVEMIVYNTDNNIANLIKRSCIEVYMQESDFSYICKFVNHCIDTWDSLEQLPDTTENRLAQTIANTRYINYTWDNATGRWVNLSFNNTEWGNMDFRWEDTDITDLSKINNYTFPTPTNYSLLEVSFSDNAEGAVSEYRDSTTTPSAVNPTIIVEGQRSYPEIKLAYNTADEWIYIRRDDTIYQLEVLSADYSFPGFTYIELTAVPPTSFTSSPKTWQVLREIEGTIVLPGDKIYNEETNPQGIQVGKFMRVFQENSTPIRYRIPINGKNTYSGQPEYIILDGAGSDTTYSRKGEIGQIYKIRDNIANNGNLVVDTTIGASTCYIEEARPDPLNQENNIGKLFILGSACTCDPLAEIVPGYTTITLYAYKDGVFNYTQRFRSSHVYYDTSTIGNVYNIWSTSGVYVVDVVGIDGGPIDENLWTYLLSLASSGHTVYFEYEYESFIARTYYGEDNSGDMNVYFDFNTFPPSGTFIDAPSGEFAAPAIADHTNWYFDQGVPSGDFSMEVTQVGSWGGGSGTIITLSDTNNELYQSSTSFKVCQRNFDEDEAEKKLGSQVITWQNYIDTNWKESCSLSWNTLDYSTPYWCNFILGATADVGAGATAAWGIPATGSGFIFNSGSTNESFVYVGATALPAPTGSAAQRWSSGLYQLNVAATGGPGKFSYSINPDPSWVSSVTAEINTYASGLTFSSSSSLSAGDVIHGKPFRPSTTVSSITGSVVTIDREIEKKAVFGGDCVTGEYRIKNITGLLENTISPGDIITASTLYTFPTAGAAVAEIKAADGVVREISLTKPFTSSGTGTIFQAEYGPCVVTAQRFSGSSGAIFTAIASAKTPGVDCLGTLSGITGAGLSGTRFTIVLGPTGVQGNSGMYNGVPSYSSPTAHSFPLGNYYNSWLGYGNGKIGSFLNGIEEFTINYRNIQVYKNEGVDPNNGYPGWYPGKTGPRAYSSIPPIPSSGTGGFTAQGFTFTNYKEAKADSERLPYERSIGGALTWEETWAGKTNGKIPIGTSVIFTSNTSKIAGKTKYLWRIKENGETLVETLDSQVMWNFTYPGVFGVELTISDTNGNTRSKKKETFIEVSENVSE
jgi:hypothetical protein